MHVAWSQKGMPATSARMGEGDEPADSMKTAACMSFAKRRGPLNACLNAKACCEASEPTTSADANAKACHVVSTPTTSANANASRVASAPTTSADAIASC